MKNFIPVTRPLLPDFDDFVNELRDVWDNQWLTNYGPKHQKLEAELKSYLGVENISLFTNGHLALQVALRALELKGEIITTPFTYASTTHAIVECGCTPVFCDIDPVTLTTDTKKIEDLITEKTTAILAVHVYGTACDHKELKRIANKHNLKLIYDAAHTFGVTVDGKGIGSLGDISMFSFHATKVFNTIEGGCLTYSDPSLKQKIEAICSFGFEKNTSNALYVGTNAKMTEVSAVMGLCNLKIVDESLKKRKKVFEYYNEKFKNFDALQLICEQEGVKTNYSYYPIIINPDKCKTNCDQIAKKLEEQQIIPRRYFAPLTSEFSCYKNCFKNYETPVADFVSKNVLVLPLYPNLNLEECEKIYNIIVKELEK